jgi:hypothetical protein
MAKYSVPITTKTLSVFIVEARNGSDAAFQVAEAIANGAIADQTTNLGRVIGAARPLVDEPTAP